MLHLPVSASQGLSCLGLLQPISERVLQEIHQSRILTEPRRYAVPAVSSQLLATLNILRVPQDTISAVSRISRDAVPEPLEKVHLTAQHLAKACVPTR